MEVTGGRLPYLGSLLWYRLYLRSLLAGGPCPEPERKSMHRCLVRCNKGTRLLTVPVLHDNRLRISEHGNWRQVHMQALMSEYGRSAYYPYLVPRIEAVITGGATEVPVINRLLHEIVMDTVAPADTLKRVAAAIRANPCRWSDLHNERSRGEKEELSVIDVLMRRGPEAIFVLVDAL